MWVGIHAVAAAGRGVLDVAQAKRATAVLVALEFSNGGLGGVCVIESDNAASARTAARFVLNLSLLDLADRRKQFDQVIVARRPRELHKS